ncbi:transposase [Paenimyroides aestuarii]|uniref:Transposase n=1 Tax=Paenimyroides aestuarii TaxID=2968490 RepID=A0ABY5NW40_9FLAO|nr:transposase [Paenimyroides aestuarii]UUV22770.1 transposase [Paenimyroides aestuarii]
MKLETLEKGYCYHIYNRGINSCNVFSNDKNKLYFLSLLKRYLTSVVTVFAYCLMDNHFHLVVRIDDKSLASQSFSNLFNAYAKAYNKEQNRTGSLFEKHFKRVQLKDDKYLKNLIIYVHLNPLHHLNQDYTQFQFSSYRSFLSDKATQLARNEVIEMFDNIENFVYCHSSKQEILTEIYTLE